MWDVEVLSFEDMLVSFNVGVGVRSEDDHDRYEADKATDLGHGELGSDALVDRWYECGG